MGETYLGHRGSCHGRSCWRIRICSSCEAVAPAGRGWVWSDSLVLDHVQNEAGWACNVWIEASAVGSGCGQGARAKLAEKMRQKEEKKVTVQFVKKKKKKKKKGGVFLKKKKKKKKKS